METNEINNQNSQNGNGGSANSDKYVKRVEQVAKKEGIAKGARITALISIVVLIAVAVIFFSKYKHEQTELTGLMENQKSSYTVMLNSRDSTINEWMITFDQIEKGLQAIREKEKIISINANDKEFSKEKKEQVLEDIKYINSMLDQNKKKIASLTEQLKRSGGTIKSLQVKIIELEASIKQNEQEVSELKLSLTDKNFKIDQLNTRMTDMQSTINQKDETIVSQIAELNKAFITTGTFKELRAKGVESKEGGFLGLGKKKSLIENFPDSSFTQIDITKTKTIQVNAKKAKLITEHPKGSYEMVMDNDKIAYVDIIDPEQFWKISKYAVVEVSK